MRPNEDFRFRDDLVKNVKDTVPIELMNDPFAGIIYRYDQVQIKEETDHAKLSFSYSFLELKDFDEKKLRENKIFVATLGNILNSMILETIDSANDTESRISNIEESFKE